MKDHIKWLRDYAAAAEKANPELAKAWREQADKLEKEEVAREAAKAASDAAAAAQNAAKAGEEMVASRIASGDLVVKAKHVEAVTAAEKAGYDKRVKEVADAEAAAKKQADTIASRVEKIKAEKLDPKGVVTGTKTLEAVASGMPIDEAGEKAFAEKLDEWKEISKKTGLWKLAEGTASATGGAAGKVPPHGGDVTSNDKSDKPGWAML
jgi:hypothetical protein